MGSPVSNSVLPYLGPNSDPPRCYGSTHLGTPSYAPPLVVSTKRVGSGTGMPLNSGNRFPSKVPEVVSAGGTLVGRAG